MFSCPHWLPGLEALVEKRTEPVPRRGVELPVSGMCPGCVLHLLGPLHTILSLEWQH